MKHILKFLLILSVFAPYFSFAAPQPKPKLVVNIVVSQMRYDYLTRFSKNMSNVGFKRFMDDGMVFTEARYNFMQTVTPAALATLTTGANPSTHGVISNNWIDYTTNNTISLIEDNSVRGLDCDAGIGCFSSSNLTAPTFGDRLKEQSSDSKVITVAADPVSAIVLGGFGSNVYWLDDTRCNWISSTAYMSALPSWVDKHNSLRFATQYLDYTWNLVKPLGQYINRASYTYRKLGEPDFPRRMNAAKKYSEILRTPKGNTLVTEFAKQALACEFLGQGEHADMLTICYDTPRYIGERFGGESVEVEDMLYQLDSEIGDLISFIFAQVGPKNVVITLTSDHGASDSYDHRGEIREKFNSAQLRIIVNGFLGAQYGSGDWVTGYFDRQLYLNRTLIYQKGLDLGQVQARAAGFILQFHGVSHVLTSTAMQSGYFGGGYACKMQNGFYPKRSGDITINLMPGWIEENKDNLSASGSMYEYDTHVPLMLLGSVFGSMKIDRPVDMREVAPTLGRIMKISSPIAAEMEPMAEVAVLFD